MNVVIKFETKEFTFTNIIGPITVLRIKQMFYLKFGVPVRHQRLFSYPDQPHRGPGPRLCQDDESFVQGNPNVDLILTLGEVSNWAHFYVTFPRYPGEEGRVLKVFSNRFDSIHEIKQRIFADHDELRAHALSKQELHGHLLEDDSNLYQCQVENGTILYFV